MRTLFKSAAMVSIVALLAACVQSYSTAGDDVDGLERVTGDDLDGDCQTPGPSEADGPASIC